MPGLLSRRSDRRQLLSRLEDVEASIAAGDAGVAISQLNNLRRRVDGCGTAADRDDWIVGCSSQLIVRGMIDDMILALGG